MNSEDLNTKENWLYVIIQNPGTEEEEFLGYEDTKTQEKFIPAFKNQEDAKACFNLMPKDLFKAQYDTQAVIQEDLVRTAEENGHKIYLLDEKGRILAYLNEDYLN